VPHRLQHQAWQQHGNTPKRQRLLRGECLLLELADNVSWHSCAADQGDSRGCSITPVMKGTSNGVYHDASYLRNWHRLTSLCYGMFCVQLTHAQQVNSPPTCGDTAPDQPGASPYQCPPGYNRKPDSDMATPPNDNTCCTVSTNLLIKSMKCLAFWHLHLLYRVLVSY
jgi:hypothetical protein